MSKLVIVVPANRHRCGRALLFGNDGSTRFGPFRVLATASGWAAKRHGNETRDWRKPFGHPPAGSYVVGGSLPPGASPRPRRLRRFGPLGALVLTPTAGSAIEASKAGRRRFLLHGGPSDRRGRLRPTFGGFRVSDRELAGLLQAVNDANAASDPVSSVEVVETTDRPPWTDDGPRDRAGRLRPDFLKRRRRRRARGGMSLGHAALIALGFGIAGKGLKAEASTGRRSFVGLAILTLGAIGAGCSSATDAPSPDVEATSAGLSPSPSPPPGPGSGSGNAPDAGTGDDGGGANGGYAGGYGDDTGGDDMGGGGGGTTAGGGPGSGDDTGDDSSGGAG